VHILSGLKINRKIPHTIYLPEKESEYISHLVAVHDATKSQIVEALINYYVATSKDNKDYKFIKSERDDKNVK
jgi:hypothetical protein